MEILKRPSHILVEKAGLDVVEVVEQVMLHQVVGEPVTGEAAFAKPFNAERFDAASGEYR